MFIETPVTSFSVNRRKLIHGVGVNDAPYNVYYVSQDGKRYQCPYYRTWVALLTRCFSEQSLTHRPTYLGSTVESSWLLFSNFREWMIKQNWEGKALDKDILGKGQKHYGPNTCLFISKELNNLLTSRNNKRGDYPVGVSRVVIKENIYYVAKCRMFGKKVLIGYFKTPHEAATAYNNAKLSHIKELARMETDPRVQQGLLSISL